ncbi:class F sortase [Alkalihalophilus sp. As8PL]|uniref:Class F sortase n=1 Tax=Alkalihalophilus sp. As8PL TaxID=3237103 RepID=A0AB39BQX1_9BACI
MGQLYSFLTFVVNKKLNSLLSILLTLFILVGCTPDNSFSEVQEEPEIIEMKDSSLDEVIIQSNQQDVTSSTQINSSLIPTHISIPKIEVEAPISEMGLNEKHQMDVPEDPFEVGWFNRGTKPGNQGHAVLAGHVDSRTGPAIFFDLDELSIGDHVELSGANGEQLTFSVINTAVYPYDDAPIEAIFGYTSAKRINLITCTGEFDRVERTHRERLVVTAELIN